MDRQKINTLASKTGSNRYVKHLDGYSHLVVMLYAESKVGNDLTVIFNDKAAISFHISSNDSLGRIAFSPLVHVAGLPHNPFCSIHDFHNISHVRWLGFSDDPTHSHYASPNTFLPASVIKPRDSSSLHLSLLSSVQWLPFRLGDNLCANRPSGSFFNVESIHPKHSASSTISR